jgi:formate hydrogenlyase transcriptional activator
MPPVPLPGLANRSWAYGEVASSPLPSSVEDEMLSALRRLTATLDITGVCEAVLSGVECVFGATSSWIMLHDSRSGLLRTAVFRGRGADVYAGVEIPADCGVAGRVFTRGEIQFVADATADPRWFDAERVRASGLRSAVVLPLIARQTRIGVLGVDSPMFGPGRPPTPLEIKRLEIFASQAAMGLLNARLYDASQKDRSRLRALLRERRTLRQQVLNLRDEIRDAHSFGAIIGESQPLRLVLAEVEHVAASDVTVLLLGETGTGKELLARALHERSSRSPRPFVAVNCAALPETLIESEMFGHERGAFTGAHMRKPGRFELAHRGTLFLDEIGELPLSAQAKLLRVLQDGEVYRVGGTQPTKVDVRLVAATNQDLPARVRDKAFREDLYYRLSVFPIRIPPLRERVEDIPLLAGHLALRCARRFGRRVRGIDQAAVNALAAYPWPGNVRELQNVIERAVILTAGDVLTPETIRLDHATPETPTSEPAPLPVSSASVAEPQVHSRSAAAMTLADAERAAIIDALRRAEGRISGPGGAAALLALRPTTLHAKMKKLGVSRGDALRGAD